MLVYTINISGDVLGDLATQKTLPTNQRPDTQKHLIPTYPSAVHVTAVKTTYLVESVYSKLRLSWTLTYVRLKS